MPARGSPSPSRCCSLCSRLAQGQAAAVRVVPLLYSTAVRIPLYSVHAPQYLDGPGSARRALSAMVSTRVFRAAREHSNAFQGGNRGSNPLGGTNVYKGFSPPSFIRVDRVAPSWGQSGANLPIKCRAPRPQDPFCGLPRTRRDQRRYDHGTGCSGSGGKRRRVSRRGGRHGRTHALTDQRDEPGMGLLMSARRPSLVTAGIEVDAPRVDAG